MESNTAPLLEMRGIKKDFFGNQVLTDINFTLKAGEVLGLAGENGAGKSTLMKILFGMDVIRETGGYGGDVLINGEKVTFNTPFDALEAGIGMVHQEFSLIPGFTATENILLNREPQKKNVISEVFGPRLNTLDYKKMKTKAAEAIDKMGVEIDQNMVISDMPVGHKQFTEIARELSKDQLKLLILDEPTAVLTEKEAAALLDSIRGMASRGIAVIFITHRLQEVLNVCDKVVIMRDGKVVKDTPASETSVDEITRCMVGRSVDLSAVREIRDCSDARTIMSIRKLWVDMPGEIVRNVNLDVKEGEILGIGGLAGQGKLGIPNGVMGLAGDAQDVGADLLDLTERLGGAGDGLVDDDGLHVGVISQVHDGLDGGLQLLGEVIGIDGQLDHILTVQGLESLGAAAVVLGLRNGAGHDADVDVALGFRVSGLRRSLGFVAASVGGGVAFAAGNQGQGHGQGKQCAQQSFHTCLQFVFLQAFHKRPANSCYI